MKWTATLLALISFCLCTVLFGQQSLLANSGPDEQAFYLAPAVYNKTLLGPLGDGISHWQINQWNIPSPLPTTISREIDWCSTKSVFWQINNTYGGVCYAPFGYYLGTHNVELRQNGEDIKCGEEYDLFIAPTSEREYPGYTNGFITSPPLSSLPSLTFTLGATILESKVSNRCGSSSQCGESGHVDYGYAVFAIIFDNFNSQQTLFYQIILYDTRAGNNCSFNPCETNSQQWFSTKQPFGVNDSIGSYSAKCLKADQGRQHYRLDVLPKVKDAIREGKLHSLDQDLNNWQATGLYAGIGLQGSVYQKMFIDTVYLFY